MDRNLTLQSYTDVMAGEAPAAPSTGGFTSVAVSVTDWDWGASASPPCAATASAPPSVGPSPRLALRAGPSSTSIAATAAAVNTCVLAVGAGRARRLLTAPDARRFSHSPHALQRRDPCALRRQVGDARVPQPVHCLSLTRRERDPALRETGFRGFGIAVAPLV